MRYTNDMRYIYKQREVPLSLKMLTIEVKQILPPPLMHMMFPRCIKQLSKRVCVSNCKEYKTTIDRN